MIFFFTSFGSSVTLTVRILIPVLIFVFPSVVFSSEEIIEKRMPHHLGSAKAEFLAPGSRAPAFRLTSPEGNNIGLADFSGSPVFITFIYTSCKSSCSLILQNMDLIREKVNAGPDLVFLAITVDPETDTVPVLKEYLENTGLSESGLNLLTGEKEDVNIVLKNYKVKVARLKETGEVLGHPDMGYLIDVNGLIRDIILFEI